MTRGSTLLLDTNVLLSATDRARLEHASCLELLRRAADSGVHFVVTGQVLREYLVVATRSIEANGLGLSPAQAVRNTNEFRTRVHLLPETREVSSELTRLVAEHSVQGKRIHDANIVAAAHHHHVGAIITANTVDYDGLCRVSVLTPAHAMDAMQEL